MPPGVQRQVGSLRSAAVDASCEVEPGSHTCRRCSDPTLGVETRFPPVFSRPAGKRTGPGELLAFRGQILAAEGEASQFAGGAAKIRRRAPHQEDRPGSGIFPSRWANRHESSFATADFIRFKADIEHAGGNVQPIVVRPLGTDERRDSKSSSDTVDTAPVWISGYPSWRRSGRSHSPT